MVELAVIGLIATGLAFRIMRMTAGSRANQPLDKKSFLLHVGGIACLLVYMLISRLVIPRGQDQQEKTSTDMLLVEAEAFRRLDQLPEATECASRALSQAERRFGQGDVRTVPALQATARCLTSQKKSGEAEALFQRSLALQVKAFGEDSVESADGEYALGWHFHEMKRLEEAETRYKRALSRTERVVGQVPAVLPKVLAGLADLCQETGRVEEAKDYRARAQAFKPPR